MIEIACGLLSFLALAFLLGISFIAGMVAGIVILSTDAVDVFNEWRKRRRMWKKDRPEP